jgi:flagellar biosynthesis GTPase FlhF
MNRCIYSLLFLTVCYSADGANSIVERVKEGNRLFKENKLPEAMNKYQDARTDAPETPELHYNIGNVYYAENRFQDAINSYEKALLKGATHLKSRARYNLGNATYRMAQRKESGEKLEEALGLAKKSLEHYKDARYQRKKAMGRHFTEDADLNHNIQFAQREVRRIRDKILKRQQEQQKKQDQEKKDDQNQEQKQDQQQQDQQQQQNQEQSQDKTEQEQQKQGEQKQQQNQQPKEQQQKKKAQKLTPEQAKRMLEQLTDKEKEELKKRRMRYGGGRYVEKDW